MIKIIIIKILIAPYIHPDAVISAAKKYSSSFGSTFDKSGLNANGL